MRDSAPPIPPPLTPEPRRSRLPLILSIALVIVAVSAFAWWRSQAAPPAMAPVTAVADPDARAPAGQRIRVRVVNATGKTGLARRATLHLRDFGYDVVDFDSDQRRRTTTAILLHADEREWAERLKRALGVGEIEAVADSLRYLDVTVLLGNDWKPPAQPLRP